tara:strand:- start:1023 stop:2537 length:1515 start_codon:yes stop_codon:yes gene_type:complete
MLNENGIDSSVDLSEMERLSNLNVPDAVQQNVWAPKQELNINPLPAANDSDLRFTLDFFQSPSQLPATEIAVKAIISVLGLGYVGAVSAACFCDRGHSVIGVDPDVVRVETLNRGESPIVEEGLAELLGQARQIGRLEAICDTHSAVIESDITLVCVGTPTGPSGECDLKYLRMASEQIGGALALKQDYHLVAFRSTVPPKTTREVLIPILEATSGKRCGKDFGVCFNPEFLRESTAISDFYEPPKTVIGAVDQRSAAALAQLYKGLPGELVETSIEAAEFVKYIDNTWHGLKVGFGNEVGRLCKVIGVDSHKVMDIFMKDTKLNISPYYLRPGFAFGGSCLPKDTRGIMHLAAANDVSTPLIDSIIQSNDKHIEHTLALIAEHRIKRIGIVGLTFKAYTDDLRESPLLELVRQLRDQGHVVSYFDPNASSADLLRMGMDKITSDSGCTNIDQLVGSIDLLVVGHNTDYGREAARAAKRFMPVIDLVGLGNSFKYAKNCEGVCW